MEKVKFLNIDILNISQDELLNNFKHGVLITPNVDHLVKLQKDVDFYNAYQKSEWVVCDSRIIYFVSKLLSKPLKCAIPGSSFFTAFYMHHRNNKNCKIFLLGGRQGIAEKARNNINDKVGWEMVIGSHSPSFGFEKDERECEQIIDIINNSGANVLMVGLGAPKQEIFITKYREKMKTIDIFMGLGATIDFEANAINRAPKWMQYIGMEWFYRCVKEPKRLFKRYFVEDFYFFICFAKQLIGKYKNPFE